MQNAASLPAQLTPFVGRTEELANLESLITRPDVRLVTLNGPGGVGKTRLALQAAGRMTDLFADGVHFADLAPLLDPGFVLSSIAQALEVREQDGRELLDCITTSLGQRQVLLVLDNFEGLLLAAPVLVQLLSACPETKLLVTSQAVLHVSGEHVFNVAPLTLPSTGQRLAPQELAQFSAIQLFSTRAEAAQASFRLSDDNSEAVASICRQLDGLPLAIELAAARIASLPPQALLERLAHRLRVLTQGALDKPERLQTLRNAVSWSYELLANEEKALFRRMAVFAGSFGLEAAEGIQSLLSPTDSDCLDGITTLVDHSLLQVLDEDTAGPRFTMLGTLREFGLDELAIRGEMQAVRRAHAAYYAALAESADEGLRGGEQKVWRDRIETEINNLRDALSWTTNGPAEAIDADAGLRITGALWYFWFQRGFLSEGRGWLERALAASTATTAVRGRALLGAGSLAWRQGDYAQAADQLNASLAIWRAEGDVRGEAESIHVLGHVYFDERDYVRAGRLFEQSHDMLLEIGDRAGSVPLVGDLGMVAYHLREYEKARQIFGRSLNLAKEYGLSDRVADALIRLGDLIRLADDLPQANALYAESLARWRELNATPGIASALHKLGQVRRLEGNPDGALALIRESIELQLELGNKQGIAECLAGLAGVAVLAGDGERALRLLGACATLLESIGAPLAPADEDLVVRDRALATTLLGPDAAARTWAEGLGMLLDAAIASAPNLSQQRPRGALPSAVAAKAAETSRLSPRELEVASLVGRGVSNREIAESLTITEKTAANHIEHIMNKLEVHSRTQIAIWAIENGLSPRSQS